MAVRLPDMQLGDVEADADRKLLYNVWDFGGQRVFQIVQNMFLTRFGVYNLVFSVLDLLSDDAQTREEAHSYLIFWLRAIGLYAGGAPVFLVGTHAGGQARPHVLWNAWKVAMSPTACWLDRWRRRAAPRSPDAGTLFP